MRVESNSSVGRRVIAVVAGGRAVHLANHFVYHLSLAWASNLDQSTSELVPADSLSVRVERYFSTFQRIRLSNFSSGGGAVRGFVS